MAFIGKIIDYYHLYKQELLANLDDLWQLWPVRIYLAVFGVLNLSAWLGANHIYRNIGQPELALHYSVDFGIDIYGPAGRVFILPLLGLIFFFWNALVLVAVASFNKKDVDFVSHLLLLSANFAGLLLLAALASIYLVNFR